MVARRLEAVGRLVESDCSPPTAKPFGLTAQGQLLSNDVFQGFIAPQRNPPQGWTGAGYCMISLNLENYLEVSVIHRLRQPRRNETLGAPPRAFVFALG